MLKCEQLSYACNMNFNTKYRFSDIRLVMRSISLSIASSHLTRLCGFAGGFSTLKEESAVSDQDDLNSCALRGWRLVELNRNVSRKIVKCMTRELSLLVTASNPSLDCSELTPEMPLSI